MTAAETVRTVTAAGATFTQILRAGKKKKGGGGVGVKAQEGKERAISTPVCDGMQRDQQRTSKQKNENGWIGGWGGGADCVLGTPMGSGNHVTSPHIATEALTYMPPPPPARPRCAVENYINRCHIWT